MSDTYWTQLFTFLGVIVTAASGIAAIFAVKANGNAKEAKKQAKDTHTAVNSRMDELLALAKESSKAEGVKEEKERQQ